MEPYYIFTDGGGFLRDEKGYNYNSSSAYRILTPDRKLIQEEGHVVEHKTNQFGELYAATKALDWFYWYTKIYKLEGEVIWIVTDSMHTYRSLEEWIYGWMKRAKNGVFYSSNKSPVLHQEVIKEGFHYLQKIRERGNTVKFLHINSHFARKDVPVLKKAFEKFNKTTIHHADFLFLYEQNRACDLTVKREYTKFVENNNHENIYIEIKL